MATFKIGRCRLVAAACVGLLALSGCATNTMTGRMQLKLVSDEGVAKQSVSYYSAMVSEFDKKKKLVESGPVKERIDGITNRLIEQAVRYRPESRDWKWRVVVVDEPKTINAFCMPGGLMGIYTGFMEQLDATDDEIAQVMGHEIGHALAGHGAEKMSVQFASNIAVLAASAALANNNREFNRNQAVLTVGALAFVNLPNSRDAESEADRIGIELAARAGADPAAAVSLWNKMHAESGGGNSDFFRTHPSSGKRSQAMSELQEPMLELTVMAMTETDGPYDWLYGDPAQRPHIEPSQAIALYSPQWDQFTKGRTVLAGNNVAAYMLKQGFLKDSYDKNNWRDLAHHVLDLDFNLDLAYYYLGKAAIGLGFIDAGARYLQEAAALSHSEKNACAKRTFLSCPDVDLRTYAAESPASNGFREAPNLNPQKPG